LGYAPARIVRLGGGLSECILSRFHLFLGVVAWTFRFWHHLLDREEVGPSSTRQGLNQRICLVVRPPTGDVVVWQPWQRVKQASG